MAKYRVQPTGRESPFHAEELIVSKTDPKGRITYANEVFLRVAQFTEREVLGQPHSLVRHPDMPRCVFKLLWDTLEAKKEIFAYVLNMTKHGDHYWVFAHVTPTLDAQGAIVGYHSNRRCPYPEQIEKVKPLYGLLLAEEQKYDDRKIGMNAAFNLLVQLLQNQGVSYDEFVFSL